MVTPCVGVWIETRPCMPARSHPQSHPAWVCGLKLPLELTRLITLGHTLRGCVD